MSLSININEKANLIWAIADKLTGVYKPHEYGDAILPLVVLKRFDSILEDTKDEVLNKYEEVKDLSTKDSFLKRASGYEFYNISNYTFQKLLDDPDNIESNLTDYINGFSENVYDIIEKFDFFNHIERMGNKGILFSVIKEFTTDKADLHPDKISNLEMGYIFEEIIRRFSEAHNEDAGQHYTPREVIELMVNILFCDSNKALADENIIKTIYDPACGTGGMLSVAEEYLQKLNKNINVFSFGQELNDQTYAICKSDMLIKGNNAEYIKLGNTLSNDAFSNKKFDYILSNPPFGREWKNEEIAILEESKLGFEGRFGAGLPSKSDGQMLFLQTVISKMKEDSIDGSRIAIIHNGSPLFTGDAGSGPSEIRKYIIENDLLEAIIGLPNDIFYNTGIATYIWVLSNKKDSIRKGKVQLINANEMYEKRRKSLGSKRNDIPEEAIKNITKIYGDFIENDNSKIFDNIDFGYSKITVERPLRSTYSFEEERISFLNTEDVIKKFPYSSKKEITNQEGLKIYNILKDLDDKIYYSEAEFKKILEEIFEKNELPNDKKVIKYLLKELCKTYPKAPIVYNKKGEPVADTSLRDYEKIPLNENIEEYFKREVLPYVEDAWIDYDKTKVGYEIPFTRYFYKYTMPRKSDEIMKEIMEIQKELDGSLEGIFNEKNEG